MRLLELHRRRLDLTQADTGRILGVHQNAISEMERGRAPNPEERAALERVFGMPAERVLRELLEEEIPESHVRLAILARQQQLRDEQAAKDAEREARRAARGRR